MLVKRILLAAAMALVVPAALHAQTQTIDGISNMRRAALSPIYAGNEVKGYVMFTRGDKADRKNDNYLLDLYDQDLTKVSSITIQKPAGYTLLKNTFNGSAFAFYFANGKDQTLEIETYDTSLKKLGSKVIGDLSGGDKRMLAAQAMSADPAGNGMMGMNLIPVPGLGFVRNGYTGAMAKGYTLAIYDDKLNMHWRITSDEKSKQYESLSITEAADKYLLGMMMRRDGLMSHKFNFSMVALDAKTGKKLLDMPVETSPTEQLSLSSFTFDPSTREFVAVGEYYKLDDKPMVNKSQGFFVKRFSEAGKVVSAKNYGWHNEVAALMPAEAKASQEDNYVNFNHAVVKGADGRMYIVAEQFKIVGDGLGIAMKALGGGTSVSKGKIANLLVFELDPQAKLSNVKFFPKTVTNAEIPPGAGLMGSSLLGMIMKAQGDFDYQFLQKDDANTQFNVVYLNFDKEKGEAAKGYIGGIGFGNSGKYTTDKIELNAGPTYSYLYPAKPGYVMVTDYYKKKKQLGMKLLKMNI
ncbi:DUF6770 family protein [Hymenobacter convexus]|uniref:DUF6770 family protein n=1 Tax=Hymenobacter sp. CA1UV-4 TaxID=3063782 RepID=UPI0027127EAE|nr:DUF6770 family protein [Hymenobacter sp. CA1UV-4]MDO7851214.1 hypothetical protein [Hymenobacter sp. CA1UV-4]